MALAELVHDGDDAPVRVRLDHGNILLHLEFHANIFEIPMRQGEPILPKRAVDEVVLLIVIAQGSKATREVDEENRRGYLIQALEIFHVRMDLYTSNNKQIS